jgi:hypothetical protein
MRDTLHLQYQLLVSAILVSADMLKLAIVPFTYVLLMSLGLQGDSICLAMADQWTYKQRCG